MRRRSVRKRNYRKSRKRDIRKSVRRNVRKSSKRNVRKSVRRNVRKSVRKNLRKSVRRNVRKSVRKSSKRNVKGGTKKDIYRHSLNECIRTILSPNEGIDDFTLSDTLKTPTREESKERDYNFNKSEKIIDAMEQIRKLERSRIKMEPQSIQSIQGILAGLKLDRPTINLINKCISWHGMKNLDLEALNGDGKRGDDGGKRGDDGGKRGDDGGDDSGPSIPPPMAALDNKGQGALASPSIDPVAAREYRKMSPEGRAAKWKGWMETQAQPR